MIFIGFTSYSSYTLIIPFFNNIDMTSINTIVTYLKSLSNGCLKICSSMPAISRILKLFYSIHHYLSYIPSSKKGFFIKNDIFYVLSSFQHRRAFYSLASISRFRKIHIATIVENNNYSSYGLNNSTIPGLFICKLEYFRTCIIYLFSKYKTFGDNMLLNNHEQIVSINTKFNNRQVEELTISLANLKDTNNKESFKVNFFKDEVNKPCIKAIGNIINYASNLEDKTKALMDYTSPGKNGYNIQLFMQNYTNIVNSASSNNNISFN